MSTSWQSWLGANPYLAPLTRLHGALEAALARSPERLARVGSWDAWREDAAAGVPLLHSAAAEVDFSSAAATTLAELASSVDVAAVPPRLAGPLEALKVTLASDPGAAEATVGWLSSGSGTEEGPTHTGLAWLLGWTAARRVLTPVALEAGMRDATQWGRGQCPTCGAWPAMAQLAEGDGGRTRLLVCGCCATRWRYRRIGCPYCESDAPERQAILELEGDAPFRLDVCGTCRGYLKTYVHRGDEALFLSDWSTLHLDVAAARHGLQRHGPSLYDFTETPARS